MPAKLTHAGAALNELRNGDIENTLFAKQAGKKLPVSQNFKRLNLV
jgi:hypothetical protein